MARKRTNRPVSRTPLAAARAQLGISLLDLATAIEYDKGNLSKIERGVMRPSAALAIKLSAFFGDTISRDELMFPEFHKPVAKAKVQTANLQEVA